MMASSLIIPNIRLSSQATFNEYQYTLAISYFYSLLLTTVVIYCSFLLTFLAWCLALGVQTYQSLTVQIKFNLSPRLVLPSKIVIKRKREKVQSLISNISIKTRMYSVIFTIMIQPLNEMQINPYDLSCGIQCHRELAIPAYKESRCVDCLNPLSVRSTSEILSQRQTNKQKDFKVKRRP